MKISNYFGRENFTFSESLKFALLSYPTRKAAKIRSLSTVIIYRFIQLVIVGYITGLAIFIYILIF